MQETFDISVSCDIFVPDDHFTTRNKMEITYIHFISGQVLGLEHLGQPAMDNLFRKLMGSRSPSSLPLHIHEYAIALDKVEYITFPKSFTPTKE